THSVTGMREPQGVAFLPDLNRIVVANGGDGQCVVVDGRRLRVTLRTSCGDDADNVRYDRAAGLLYVGAGRGRLPVHGAADHGPVGEIPLEGHPEAFALEPGGPQIFVNVPTAGHVAVVDRGRRAVTATWRLSTARANFPLALDSERHRVFVGCRQPARLLIYDPGTGRLVAEVAIAGDVDDLAYDAARRRIYAAGGEGAISVVEQVDADHYRSVDRIPTARGARTALFVPELGRLYVAVPHRGSQAAEIRGYAVAPWAGTGPPGREGGLSTCVLVFGRTGTVDEECLAVTPSPVTYASARHPRRTMPIGRRGRSARRSRVPAGPP